MEDDILVLQEPTSRNSHFAKKDRERERERQTDSQGAAAAYGKPNDL